MRIITDSSADLSPEQVSGKDLTIIPLHMSLEGIDYRSGLDITNEELYAKLFLSPEMPVTFPPTAIEFQQYYGWVADSDPEILSIHLSSGLSQTAAIAREAAQGLPDAEIAVIDSGSITVGLGWQVEAAVRAARAAWSLDETLALVNRVRRATDMMFTVADLKHLIHGGRISHLMGGIANIFDIKPIIGIDPQTLMYENRSMKRSFANAIRGIADLIETRHPRGSALRAQIGHVYFPEACEDLETLLEDRFEVSWLPVVQTDPVLGAHTGPYTVGIAYASLDEYPELP